MKYVITEVDKLSDISNARVIELNKRHQDDKKSYAIFRNYIIRANRMYLCQKFGLRHAHWRKVERAIDYLVKTSKDVGWEELLK